MRLVAQSKGGFYPVAEEVVRLFAGRLVFEDPGRAIVLDPCCGEGDALAALLEAAGVSERNGYAIELDEGRSVAVRKKLPASRVVGSADFLGTTITGQSMSLVWLNPPFDDEYGGGGRVEMEFLARTTTCLVKGGVLAFVLPESVLDGDWRIREHLSQWYRDLAVFAFPEKQRRFGEVLVIGTRKERPVRAFDGIYQGGGLLDLADCDRTWKVPVGMPPRRFEKSAPTPGELVALLENSPLNRWTEPPELPPTAAPPLPLNVGHVALLLASGQIDGVIRPKDEPAHVVRGVAHKTEHVDGVEEEENADGSVTTKTTYKQRIELVVRAVDETGTIHDFQ